MRTGERSGEGLPVLDFLPPKLRFVQVGVQPAPRHQLGVRPLLHQAALVHWRQNLIRGQDGRQPVGDDQAAAARQQGLQCRLDQRLAVRVQVRCRPAPG